jgi:DNA (cytosine-5)-methyltransferase 1
MLLPDELKQIQTFPADFEMRGNNKKQIVQIGNAVPPLLIEKIVKHIL